MKPEADPTNLADEVHATLTKAEGQARLTKVVEALSAFSAKLAASVHVEPSERDERVTL
jgi:hypothetical protein